ncbi:hypothetical protein Tco_1265745 [Tanacetum coccineum]
MRFSNPPLNFSRKPRILVRQLWRKTTHAPQSSTPSQNLPPLSPPKSNPQPPPPSLLNEEEMANHLQHISRLLETNLHYATNSFSQIPPSPRSPQSPLIHPAKYRRLDHGTKRSRSSNPSSSSNVLNHPSSSRHIDENIDENDEESLQSNTLSPSQIVHFMSNTIPRIFENPPHENQTLHSYQIEILKHQSQIRDEHRKGLRSIGKALMNIAADGVDPRKQTFSFCHKPLRSWRPESRTQSENHVLSLPLDSGPSPVCSCYKSKCLQVSAELVTTSGTNLKESKKEKAIRNIDRGLVDQEKNEVCCTDSLENDWWYMAVTAFLVKLSGSSTSVCFIVVACSDTTVTLRALVLQ